MEILTRENLLNKVSQKDIYEYYLGEAIDMRKSYKNPLRADKRPGCRFYHSGHRLYLYDFSKGNAIDCFEFIMTKYNCGFYESLCKINKDFDLGLICSSNATCDLAYEPIPSTLKISKDKVPKQRKRKIQFKVHTGNWTESRLKYWNEYGITRKTLKKYNVYPVLKYYAHYGGSSKWRLVYHYREKDHDLAYCYKFEDGEFLSFKIYRPSAHPDDKWRTNTSADVIQGWDQLPDKGDLVIVTSSLKDVMALYEAGYAACAPQCETYFLSECKIKELKKRFKKVVICYDTDPTGMTYSREFAERFDVKYIALPKYPDCKDSSDIAKKYKVEVLSNIIRQLINNVYSTNNECEPEFIF